MPGFFIAATGNGGGAQFGNNSPSNIIETRRSYRWYFQTLGRGSSDWSPKELLLLQKAKRPTFKYSELTMDHQQDKAYYAGKQEWEAITLTWYDVEQEPDTSRGLYIWLETVCNLSNMKVNHPSNYKKQARLKLVDGAGNDSETWDLYGTWPTNFNWQELDYTNDAILTCEATMRYDRAIRDCAPAQKPSLIAPTCGVK